MKYDSSMTHFKNDILAAIKHLLTGDKEITKKFKAEDGSPAPLREYLKEQYGKSYRGYCGDDVVYACRLTGIVLKFDTILNNLGDKELTLSWSQVAKFIRDNWNEVFNVKPPATPDNVLPERATEISETFNYSVLSAELGDFLKHKEQQLKNEYVNFTANCGAIFAEAQEKLAGNNQYNGLFEKWIASMGFNKQTVYNMISVHKFCSSKILTSKQGELFDNLGKSLQYEISKPSAPPELVEKVMHGDITKHKEYIALKKQLEEANEKAKFWSNAQQDALKENQQLRGDRNTALEKVTNLERKLNEEKYRADHLKEKLDEKSKKIGELNDRNIGLEKQVKDLQQQPVDAPYYDVDEVNRRVSEAVNKINTDTQHTLAQERKDFADALNAKDDKIWALEDRVKELEARPPKANFKSFLINMTAEQFAELLKIVKNTCCEDAVKNAKPIKLGE